MQDKDREQITNIVNAFRILNKDIRESFKIMSEKLESKLGSEKWKKREKGSRKAKEDYWDAEGLLQGWDGWYYLNYYGMYNNQVVGFTFVISIEYDEKTDTEYSKFIDKLDSSINKHSPMLCILGIYEPINPKKIQLTNQDTWQYVDSVLQFTDDWENYKHEEIAYDKWLDVEINFQDNEEAYEGWYKKAKVKIKHITDISSKEEAVKLINNLIHEM